MTRTMDRIAEAERIAATWPDAVLDQILAHQPDAWAHVGGQWYVVTVAMAQQEDESPLECAQRLQKYVQAYAERNGHAPTRASVAR